tara:strand:+ start:613 stop:1158 length:546 start_codon:yes stop_codon:yes gene_type:complete
MKQLRAATRYAKAFLTLSVEQNNLEESYNDMLTLSAICLESKELRLLLKSPIVKTDNKLKIINQIFANKISETSMRFINTIIKKKREPLLDQIAKTFIGLYKKQKNISTAIITTAVVISEELKNEIITFVKKQTSNSVELTEVVDKKIIGGAIVRIGDKQLDASILKEISELKQTFNKNAY